MTFDSFFLFYSEAFNNRVGVTILRVAGGLDYSIITDEDCLQPPINNELTTISNPDKTLHSDENFNLDLRQNESDIGLECLPVESPCMPRKYTINERHKKNNNNSPKSLLRNKKKEFVELKKEKFVHPKTRHTQ